MKIRVVPAPLYVEIMKALGAVPTPVDWPEVYNALKQGLIDGADAATDSIEYMKFYEGADHYLGTHHITGLNAMIANKNEPGKVILSRTFEIKSTVSFPGFIPGIKPLFLFISSAILLGLIVIAV